MALAKCTICGKETTSQCLRCKAANYCSKACQKIDFPLHKLLCSKYQDFLKTRPEPNLSPDCYEQAFKSELLLLSASVYRLAILFPEKGTSPKLIWLNNLTFNDEIPYQHMYNDLQKYMENPDPTPFSQFGHDIQIWMGDSCRLDGPANECIEFLDAGCEEYIAGGDDWAPLRWGGNNIVVAGERVRERAGEMIYRNVTLADLRYGLNWLTRENGCFEFEGKNPYILRAPQNWSKAVKISSSLDVLELGKKKYRDVLVRADHVVFENPVGVSEAARCLGFPLLATTYEPSCEWTSEKDREKHYNQPENEEVFCLIMSGDVRTKLNREQNSKQAKWEKKVVFTTLVAR